MPISTALLGARDTFIDQSGYLEDTKSSNLNSYASSSTLHTKYGDGILNSSDKLFSKLKVRGYDKDGNEKIANLSDVVSDIDLTRFINSDVVNGIKKEEISSTPNLLSITI